MAQGRKPDEIISAKGFVITDHDGKIRARLGFDRLNKMDGIPGLFVYDDFGTKRVAVIETSYGAGVAVYDHKGRPRCSLTYNNAMEVRSGVDATSGRGRELGNINSPIVDYLVCFPQTADRQPKKIFLKPGQADLPPAN